MMNDIREWQPIDLTDAFFPVDMRPLFMPTTATSDGMQELERHFAIVDVERDHVFSVVTADYQFVTNEEAYYLASEVIQKVFRATDVSDMVCLNVTMPTTRSFCHIDLIHRTADFEPWENDQWTAFLRITNSYNRMRPLAFELGFCRWICLNGMIFGSKRIKVTYPHTRRGQSRIEDFAENIGDIRRLEAELVSKLHQLRRYDVREADMMAVLCRALGIKVTSDELERRVDELLALREQVQALTKSHFSELGPNGYAALNVLTDYATRPKGGIAPEVRMNSLQQKVGSWSDSFLVAIKDEEFSMDEYLAEYRGTVEVIESL